MISAHGAPWFLRSDYGPELIAEEFVAWCERYGVEPRYIQPSKPDQNAYIERFPVRSGVGKVAAGPHDFRAAPSTEPSTVESNG